jgi:replicative DNA helicase
MSGNDNRLHMELAVIGGLLLGPELIGETLAELNAECFSGKQTRMIYRAVEDLHTSGAPVDALTVLDRTGPEAEALLREAMQAAPASGAMPYYREMLRKTSQLSGIQAEAMAIVSADTLEDALPHVTALNALTVVGKNVRVVSADCAAQAFYDRQQAQAKPEYIRFGLSGLDEKLYPQLGDFVVIGGYASAGKTMLSLQFAAEIARSYRVGYYSLETSTEKLTDRLMSHLSRVPFRNIKERDFSDGDWVAIGTAASTLSGLYLDLIDAGGMSVRDIQGMALAQRHQVVIVDYLQLISDPGRGRYEQVTGISQGLHTMARMNHILVVALAHLRRADKDKGKPVPPSMADFKESGQIEQDADVALLLYPEDINNYRSNRILKIAKNKEGERTQLLLSFDGAVQTFSECVGDRQVMRQLQAAGRAAKAKPWQQAVFTETDEAGDPFREEST